MNIVSYFLTFFLLFPLDENPNTKELKDYYRNHLETFNKKDLNGKLQIQCGYFPIQLIQKNTSKNSKGSKSREYTFQLLISSENKSDFLKVETDTLSFEEKVVYYSFELQKEIKLIADGKNIGNPNLYSFERSFNTGAPSRSLMNLMIPKGTKKLEIIVNDKIYDKVENRFVFDMQTIESFDKKIENTLNKKS